MANDLITFEREGARDLVVQQLIERTRRISDTTIQSADDLIPWLDQALKHVPQPNETEDFDEPFTAVELQKLRDELYKRRSEIDHGRPAARALNIVIESVDHVMRVSFGNPCIKVEAAEVQGRVAPSPEHPDIRPSETAAKSQPKKTTQDSAPRTPLARPNFDHPMIKTSHRDDRGSSR